MSYFQWGPFTTAGLATMVFAALTVLALDRLVHGQTRSNLIPFLHKTS